MKRSIGSIILLLMFVRNSSVTQQITNIISSSDSANTQTNDQQGLLKTKYKKRLEKIDHFLNELTEKKEFSGSVLISRHGQLLLSKGYGFSDYLNLSNLNTFKTMYEIGSLTKEFTALIILKLHEFGLVNVNKDYLSKYLPGYPHSHQIRIEMLLQHISGIKDYTELPLFEEVYVGKTYALNELIKLFSHLPLDFKPGTKFEYSNSNYIVLGAVIKHVMSSASTLSKLGIEDKENAYRQLLHKYILNPVKMHHTIYENGHDDNYYKEDNYREKYQIAQGLLSVF
ncbi:unnamed protein product [Didymodactylos carnosus]|uniref:Beta-lactamase-related domain-containing protein n=1 Tax=Didymodactylos carnosus TaxID=1234261 RepID=A0A815VAM0_9BILA|nr:unnamed protein product [Didymodactylos carnosus]CAF1529590.1 unnamed protein product [Didymodactylos carnosus]CAF4202796.1 unnamed protein product [Didymodactylos carnosus]CAF4388796.1 unnamed protein product [Didymodactylos carnosus]